MKSAFQQTEHKAGLRPMGALASVLYWAVPAALLYTAHYILVPQFVQRSGQPYLVGYLAAYVVTMALFLAAALAACRLEGIPIRLTALAERCRLRPMRRAYWLWALGVLVFIFVSYFGLGFTAGWLARWPLFAPHPVFPPEFGPGGAAARAAGTFMGSPITSVGWVAPVFFIGWIFNILGEEMWFRGVILPRQELAFGRQAWLANGLMFTLNHVWQPWNLLLLLPSALFGAYAVQRRKNTLVLILVHGIANASLLVVICLNALGVKI